MTVLVSALTPEGIVMTTDSRLTSLPVKPDDPDPPYVSSDQAIKLYLLRNFNAGFSLAGPIISPGYTLAKVVASVDDSKFETFDQLARALLVKISNATNQSFCFHLAGYYHGQPTICKGTFHHLSGLSVDCRSGKYCILADGEYKLIEKIIEYLQKGGWQIEGMPLLDAIDLVVLLTQSQIEFSRFRAKLSPVGGPVDVLVITPDQAYFAAHKVLRLLSPDVSRLRTLPQNPS